ncbi:hypothetical protein BGZ60DRAFT_527265 [Tricladium varicosporioides]|nr:hypothetical protein BGZ60DRAFT_527265 [Hymenoscyphus varicosporioides]
MWKTLLKGRHARQGDVKDTAMYGAGGPPPPKLGYQAPPPTHAPQPDAYGYDSRVSAGPAVEYRASAPSEQHREPQSSSFSPWAVDYDRSAPTPYEPPNMSTQSASPYAVEYDRSAPTTHGGYGSRNEDYAGKGQPYQSEMGGQGLHEMPASPMPIRYELSANSPLPQPPPNPPYPSSTPIQRPPPTPQFQTPVQTHREWQGQTTQNYFTPQPTASMNPTPPPTYRTSYVGHPTPPATPSTKRPLSSIGLQPGTVSKYTGKVFCQRKSTSKSVNPVLETPRDISEFRLAKIALIPVVAGERSFVSIDIVFGEVDKGIAGLLEKHFLVARNTTVIPTHISHGGAVVNNVCKLANLKVAYETHISMLYIGFENNEDWQRFATEFESVKHLAEATEN